MVGLVLAFLFWQCVEYSSVLKASEMEWRFDVGASVTFLYSMSCTGVVFSLGPCCHFGESNLLPWQQLWLLGDFHGIPLFNNSVECKPVPVLEDSFGDKRWPVGTLSPSLFGDFIWLTFIYFRKFLLSLAVFPHIPSLSIILSLPQHDPLIPVPPPSAGNL